VPLFAKTRLFVEPSNKILFALLISPLGSIIAKPVPFTIVAIVAIVPFDSIFP
jgi:hypothetical protein